MTWPFVDCLPARTSSRVGLDVAEPINLNYYDWAVVPAAQVVAAATVEYKFKQERQVSVRSQSKYAKNSGKVARRRRCEMFRVVAKTEN